ncbi:MAG: electron transport complex subunit RsxG [Gammaproteobacteria bacterium]|nr:electron transport complex subunit RsxG [Gammaproteobacteria bacterium]
MDNPERSGRLLHAAIVLAVTAALTTGSVVLVKQLTTTRIAANEALARQQRIAQILAAHPYDNVPGDDRIAVTDGLLGRTRQPVHRARRGGEPVASVIQVTTGEGYSGSIVLLVGVDLQGKVLAVRTLRHRETPGLGDAIEIAKHDWITRFEGASLAAPGDGWSVRRDGGRFDQLTGATVTSRAVVGAVHNALLYFDRHGERIFRDSLRFSPNTSPATAPEPK